jgi:MoxR-like ATPase
LLTAAVASGRDVLLEGPPGTSKSTLLRAITAEWGIPLVFVEGNAGLTPARLIGHHNPARVLQEDYRPDNFVDGPLVRAMRDGGFLYIEELNRVPEDTLNTLLTAMAERQITVPRVGSIAARPSFRVMASMNPYDNVGTMRLSTSLHDRLCRLAVTYQDEEAERRIVALRAPTLPASIGPWMFGKLVADSVALTRATRDHPDVRHGSSVRGAIDLTLVAGALVALRGVGSHSHSDGAGLDPIQQTYQETVFDAMVVALSGRIHLDEVANTTPEGVLRQIWERHFVLDSRAALPAVAIVGDPGRGGVGLTPLRWQPKQLNAEPTLFATLSGKEGNHVGSADRAGDERPDRSTNGPTGPTGEPAYLVDTGRGGRPPDPEAILQARRIAARLAVPRPRRDFTGQRGIGELASLPYAGGSDEIDLDSTLERLAEHPMPEEEDIVVRERVRSRRSVVLAVDISGSMGGPRIRTAAATVGALASAMAGSELAVIAFWRDAVVLAELGHPVPADRLVETLLRIPAPGLTNMAFPLQVAHRRLMQVPARDSRVVILSDCLHSAGPDPRPVAARLPRLDVLLDTSGEHDLDLARDLSRLARGRLAKITGYRDVAPAVSELFAS